jgi:hypothetical protein
MNLGKHLQSSSASSRLSPSSSSSSPSSEEPAVSVAKAKGEQDGHHLAQIGSVGVAFSWALLWYLSYTSLLSFRVSFVVSLWAKTKRKPCRNDLR